MEQFAPRKSILASKPGTNSYPACWFHIPDENEIAENPNIPTYDHEASKVSMDKTNQLTNQHKNINSEDDDWESKISKIHWHPKYTKLFNKVVQILDYDHLARLANADGKRHEIIQVRVTIDKSAERMRHALAAVSWDNNLIQWLHTILMENLPPSYLASYLDIMQTLKYKVPSLVDKMIFWKPGNVNQELLGIILKRPWQPSLSNKYRKLPGSSMVVVIPPLPRLSTQPTRVQRFLSLFATMASILPINHQINLLMAQKQSLQSIAEQIVSITRSKIQELKAENPDRRLILVGMNASASLALQVALVEQVSGVVCLGFSYNTVHGPRGQPDDQVLNLNTPILFMIGQNAARTSEEEVEDFREKLTAPSTILTIGGADDYLRVCKKKRKLEGVTQEMVDNMIVDEIAEFATKCIQRPLPAKPKPVTTFGNTSIHRQIDSSTNQVRKRKTSQSLDGIAVEGNIKIAKMKPIKLMRPTSTTSYVNPSSNEAIEMAVQSILPDTEVKNITKVSTPKTSNVTQRMKIPQGQFTTLKPQQQQSQQKYYTIDGRQAVQKTIVSISQRQQNRPSTSTTTMSSSRPSTPSHIQYITNPRMSTGKLPVAQKSQPQQTNYSPPKFTIVRATAPNSDESNIFDMPIVYADNEGNIDDEVISDAGSIIEIPSDSSASSPASGKKVMLKNIAPYVSTTPATVTITKNKNILIQKPTPQATLSSSASLQPSRMLIVNGSVIGRSVSASNIVIPKSTPSTVRIQKFITSEAKPSTIPSTRKIEILNNQIIKPAQSTSAVTSLSQTKNLTFVNLADAKPLTTRLSLPFTTTGSVKTGQQIVIKTANLKQFTLPSKQFANLTVKKLNVLPSTSATASATIVTSASLTQQKPKIIFKQATTKE